MATSQDSLNITQEDQDQLQHLSDLLHLFHHRNKNQHRRSIWYRHFSLFRKQLTALCLSLTQLNTIPTTNVARARKKTEDVKTIKLLSERLGFWKDVMVARWQHAFSQVVADGRFSVLGLVLIAVLAETCRIVGIITEFEDMGQREVEKVLEEFGREEWGAEEKTQDAQGGEDFGEVIRRDEQPTVNLKPSPPLVASPPPAKTQKKRTLDPEPKPPKKKKRKKGGDAIDDIFG